MAREIFRTRSADCVMAFDGTGAEGNKDESGGVESGDGAGERSGERGRARFRRHGEGVGDRNDGFDAGDGDDIESSFCGN